MQREIRACQDLSTPNLHEIEHELGIQLGTTVYTDDLNEINEQAILAIKQDEIDREETSTYLEQLVKESDVAVMMLDKKRKFIDELPSKIDAIAGEINAQYSLFDAVEK